MVEYAYTTVTGKIKPLLDKIRITGVPQKVTNGWLKTLGYTSSNDASLLGVLKFVGLIDQSGVPTGAWISYRGANHRAKLGDAIRKGYSDLFALYPDAHSISIAELTHVFTTSSSAGSQVIAKTVATFRALVEQADFAASSTLPENATLQSGPLHAPPANATLTTVGARPMQDGPALHIDIQIHISSDSTAQQIEKVFESMSRHLYGRKDE